MNWKTVLLVLVIVLGPLLGGVFVLLGRGFSAREEPSAVEVNRPGFSGELVT